MKGHLQLSSIVVLAVSLLVVSPAAATTVRYRGHLTGDSRSRVSLAAVVQRGKLRRISRMTLRGIRTCNGTWKNMVDQVRFAVGGNRFMGLIIDPGLVWNVRGRFARTGRAATGTLQLRTPACNSPTKRWRVRRV
jgi:hypothetical protein